MIVGLGAAFVCQIVLLAIAARNNRHMINPDGVAYLRLASYYAKGQTRLMVSGWWGPMISWLMAPLIPAFRNPLDAARIIMGLSATVFWLGSVAVLRSLGVFPTGVVLGAWFVALASVSWSVQYITPDLLLGGLLCFAISRMMSPLWTQSWKTQFGAGLLWGAAYLTKAVALPIALGVITITAILYLISGLTTVRPVLRSVGITLLGLVLLAAPWIVVLSLKYHRLVFSTSGPIAHAIVSPPNLKQGHPVALIQPEPGRITWGEDPPTQLYAEQKWSPFESRAYARHQLKIMYRNFEVILKYFASFDWLQLGFCSALLGLMVHTPWRQNLQTQRWRWVGGFLACITGVYLPFYSDLERYFFPAYPFLIAAVIGMIVWLTRQAQERNNFPRIIGICLIVISFGNPIRLVLPVALQGIDYPQGIYTKDFAARLEAAKMQGSIAGVGEASNPWQGEYIGQYLALFTNQPYFGSEPVADAVKLKSSGARLIVLDRHLPHGELENDPSFRNLDSDLFGSKQEADQYPLKAFLVTSP